MARDYSSKRGGSGSGMHLFDFNETLSGKRLPDDRKAALDAQMDKLYRGRGFMDLPNSRHSGGKRDVEAIRSMLRASSDRRISYDHGGNEIAKGHSRDMDPKQKVPSVVARLMGLDTLPSDAVPVKQSKKAVEQVSTKLTVEKYNRKQSQLQNPVPVQREAQHLTSHHAEGKGKFQHPRLSDDRKRSAAAKELPDLYELEEMKRQLALKQMLVREKLNEAKRLLTGEKVADKKWHAASEKLNQSKEFMDKIDFFQSNRDAFLKYVDDQDSVLGKHIEPASGKLSRHQTAERPVPEGLRNPIVRRVIEGRKEDALRNFARHPAPTRNYGCEDIVKNPVPENQVATRIVVLKPSPNRNASAVPESFPSGAFTNVKSMMESANSQAALPRRVADIPKDEAAVANPREIAKEIARQVRESVVRDLARNATAESGSEKRLNVSIDDSEGPRLARGVPSDCLRVEDGSPPIAKASKLKSIEGKALHSPVQKKPTRSRQQAAGGSPPLTRPVSKGIVVLIPDQSVSRRSAKNSEIQSRELVPSKEIASASRFRKDRNRRSQQGLLETSSHKAGDSFRRPKGEVNRKNDVDCSNRELTTSVKGEAAPKVTDYSSDTALPSNEVLGYGGSFLLKSSGFDSQPDNEDSCDTKDTVDSEYTADVCVSDDRSQFENAISASDCISSIGSFTVEAPVSMAERETDLDSQQVFEASPESDSGSQQVTEPPSQSDQQVFEPSSESDLGSQHVFEPSPESYPGSQQVFEHSPESYPGNQEVFEPSPEFHPESREVFESSRECNVSDIEALREVEVLPEPPMKDSPTTTDIVDVDERSVSSDNSGQPSPISVLESSFEESPGPVDFDTISSELEELRIHLRRLKWEDHEGDEAFLSDELVVDKVVVEEVTSHENKDEVCPSAEEDLHWLEQDKYDTRHIYCPDGRQQELVYVKNLLLAAGLIRNNDMSSFLVVEQHSSRHALNPTLFDKVEAYYNKLNYEQELSKSSRLKRRLLFDTVDEILRQRYICNPWLSTVRTLAGGGNLLAEVWSKLCVYFVYPQGEDLQHTVENLIEKYLSKDRWMDLGVYVEMIGVDLETHILDDLFQEAIDLLL